MNATPQTRALAIGKWGCLAMCYIYCAGVEPDDPEEYIRLVSHAMDEGLLDEECTVLSASKLLKFVSGKDYYVGKKDVDEKNIKDIKEPTPVRFSYYGSGHWVVVENGEIAFNPLSYSKSVEKGRPTSARPITLRK